MYIFNWVIKNELAIGSCPKNELDILALKEKNIKSVLCLSDKFEAPNLNYEKHNIVFKRNFLPDHKYSSTLEINDVLLAYESLKILIGTKSPLLVHCFASIERSPLLCIAYLIREKDMNFNDAVAYMMHIHPLTNPLSAQLKIIKKFCKKTL